jgi:hypothetical protein
MKAWFQKAGLNNTSIFVLLLLRMVVVLFSVVLALKTDTPSEQYIDVILLGFGIYHLLAVCIYWPAMMTPVPRLLLSVSDLLIIQAAVVLTGSVTSPFLLCVFIPVFTLHFVYGWRGLAGGLLGLLLSTAACLYAVRAFLPLNLNREGVNTGFFQVFLPGGQCTHTGMILKYLPIPFSYFRISNAILIFYFVYIRSIQIDACPCILMHPKVSFRSLISFIQRPFFDLSVVPIAEITIPWCQIRFLSSKYCQ